MKAIANILILLCLPLFVQAQALNEFQWKNRVLLLFTPEPGNPVFNEQYELLKAEEEELFDRKLIVILVEPSGDHENSGMFVRESQAEWYYNHFSVAPYQFEMILVGLDGNEKLRARNTLVPVSEIFEMIDGMPMRQRELRLRYGNTGNSNTRVGKNAVRY